MKKLFGIPHASWLYFLTIGLVVISLLFSPLAGLGSISRAQDNGSLVTQIEPDLGNLSEPIQEDIPNIPPVISGVQVTILTTNWATVVWATDKPADTVVNYGTSTGLGLTISDAGLTTDHSILLSGLEHGVTYYYEVQSTDCSSNTVTDNNGCIYYSFTTPLSDSTGEVQADQLQPAEPQKIEPLKATALVSPDKDVELKSPSEKITLDIPAGAASENLRVDFTELTPWGSTGMKIINQFELNAYAVDRADAIVSKFNKELQITIKHSPGDLAGLDVDSLRLFYLDEVNKQWVPVPSKYDSETMILSATIDHFSNYGEQANPTISGPGIIQDAQVSLSSGTATFGYTIEVPPGPGGFQPNIELTYSSGSVDEMKNKRSVGSWVGIGWTLDLGGITYDEGQDKYSLNVGGVSSELVKDKDSVYHTVRESFYKITRAGQTWNVYGPDGTYYRFGSTTNSQRYLNNGEKYYRWDLDYVCDKHGNSYSVIYFQIMSVSGTTVCSSYPNVIRYNNNHFEIYFDIGVGSDSGYLRHDNPRGTANYPAPPVVENCWLNSIETRIDSARIRKYVFTYNTTPCFLSNDYYGGIYYSGNHTLTSITELGADGLSALPATTFSYTGSQTYLHVTSQIDYPGNPGNPASLWWPRLTSINNGYGGNVSFSYTQRPGNTTNNMWTREVVTTKTITPGIGPTQTYQYTYTGNPQYGGIGSSSDAWYGEYRGFYQVRETDATGNYVQHYYITTGTMLNEYLTGKEWATEWYNASNFLLKRVDNTWQYKYTAEAYGRTGVGAAGEKRDVAVNSSGEVYALDYWNNCIAHYDSFLYPLGQWGSQGTGDGQFNSPTCLAVDSSGNVWVADYGNSRVQEFSSGGQFIRKWSTTYSPKLIAVDNSGYVYVLDWAYNIGLSAVKKYDSLGNYISTIVSNACGPPGFGGPGGLAVDNNGYLYLLDCDQGNPYFPRVMKFTTSGTCPNNYVGVHGSYGCSDGRFDGAADVTVDSGGNHWVLDGNFMECVNSQKFDGNGTFLLSFPMALYDSPTGIAIASTGEVYIAGHWSMMMYAGPYLVYLSETQERTYTYPSGSTKVSKTRYLYDSYGNVITEYRDGDTSTTDDDATVQRVFYPNTSAWILDKPARERVYATITGDVGGANQRSETRYYYDGANNDAQWTNPPTKGDLTRLQQYKDATHWVNAYYTYDYGGNRLTETDPNNNTTTYVYNVVYQNLPTSKTYPTVNGLVMTENYTWDYGSGKITSETDVNGQITTYEYDTFKRIIKVMKPFDPLGSPTIQYQYNNWGTINQQHLKTLTKVAEGNYTWQSQYFDGFGRVVQTQARGETGYTVINSTTTYNRRGLVDREYVSQVLSSGSVNGYYTPAGDWKYITYAYDALGRVTSQTSADGTTIGHDYSTPWKDLVTNERGYKKAYYNDAFDRLVKVEEYNASQALYSTTTYSYDVLNNLKQTVDNSSNTITMNYDWLSRKTSMSDPDMGTWLYTYDNNGNLGNQTDAKGNSTIFFYDALNRLTKKSYPGSGMGNVTYTYDSTTGGNNGEGRRTGMNDASGNMTYKYDARGRLIEEKHTIDSVNYTLQYGYNPADWLTTVTYPTGETVTQTYNDRGLPYTLSGSVAGNIVTSAWYNKLGQYTEINLNNGIKTTFGYWGVGGVYDNTGGYYGRLWEIKSAMGGNTRQDVKYTWDACGNVASRQDVKFGGTESFTYDFLDRLTAVSGAYTQSFSYNNMGNILSMNGSSYTYGSSRPHAVTQVGSTSYTYDNNGNMITKGSTTTFGWNVENRLGNETISGNTTTIVYDGDGNRIKKTEGGQTTIYIGKYYEKNLTTGVVTTYYYLGDKLVALRNGTNLRYIHEDSLGSTSVVTDSSGAQYGYTRYYPYGSTRDSSGSLDTNKKFTGQRLDGTGLYYYGARYYDPTIGKFISPDTVGPNPLNPQSYNRYSYCFNNPLVYIDPTGNWGWSNICKWAKDNVVAPIKETAVDIGKTVVSAAALIADPSLEHAKEFGMDLGNVALGHGTVEGIASAIESGDWGAATLEIVTGTVSLASNFVVPGGGKLVSSLAGKRVLAEGVELTASEGLRGTNNPVIRAAIDKGRRAHTLLGRQYEEGGYGINKGLRLPNGKLVKPDAIKGNHIIEIKPDTPSGIKAGQARLDYLKQYGYDVDIVYYNPAEF